MANEFVIKNGYFSQGNSNVTGSLSVTQNVTASKALFSSSGVNQLMVLGSGSSSWLTGIYGSQGNIFTATDTMSGSLFTVADISGYPVLKVISDHYTNSIQMIGTASLTGSLSITENLTVGQNLTASKALFSSSGTNQLMVLGSGSSSWLTGIYGSQGNLLTVTDTFSGSLFTITDISGYTILDITSDYYTSSIQMIGTASLTGSLSITENLTVGQNLTASKALISSSGNEQLIVMGSGSSSWITGIYGSQGNLLTVTDTFSGSVFTVSDISGYPILDVISNTSIGDSVQVIGTSSLTGSLFVNQNGNTPFRIDNNLINFYVTESKYWEVIDRATTDRLFRMQYQTTPIEGVLVQIGGISDSDTVLTVDQTAQTITLDAPTASILQLTDVAQTNVVTIDTATGQLFYTASSAFGGGSSNFDSTSSFLGNGLSSSFNINHGFNTRNLHITVYESSSNGETVYPDIRRINANTASIIFANPPLIDQYIVYISQ